MSKKIQDQKLILILAHQQVDNLVSLLEDNPYKSYMYQHLNPIKYELLRQLTNLNVTNTQTTEYNPKLSDSFGGTVEKNIPDNVEWIDDAFYIKKTRFGLYTSILKEPLGQHFITGGTKDGVITMSRWHLMCLQDNSLQDYSRVINSGVVGGKL